MENRDPDRSDDVVPDAGQPPLSESSPEVRSTAQASVSTGLVLGVLLAALLSALACWGLGEKGLLSVTADEKTMQMMGRKITGATSETRIVAQHKEAAITYGVFGALTASAIGLVIAQKQGGRSALQGLLGGLILGGVVGAGIAAILAPVILRYSDLTGPAELFLPLFVHGGIFAGIGAATGIVAGLGTRALRQIALMALGGALGAFLGGFIYDIIGAILFPLAGTAQPISGSWVTRLLCFLLSSVGVAAGTLLSLRRQSVATPADILPAT